MVLQILAHSRQVVHDRDAMRAQQFPRSDAGELQ